MTGGADSVHPARPFGLRDSSYFTTAGCPCSPLSPVSSLSSPSSLRAPGLAPMGAHKLLLVVDPEVCKCGAGLEGGLEGLARGGRASGLLVAAGCKPVRESRSCGHATSTLSPDQQSSSDVNLTAVRAPFRNVHSGWEAVKPAALAAFRFVLQPCVLWDLHGTVPRGFAK